MTEPSALAHAPAHAHTNVAPAQDAPVLLRAEQLTRRFGGLLANQNVNLTLRRGELHALLGPNGAGKSTCINLLSGDLPVSSGRVWLFDEHGNQSHDVTHHDAARRARAGIGRSYQRTNIFPAFTTLENVRLAAQSRRPQPWRLWRSASADRLCLEAAEHALHQTGLRGREARLAGALSHGEQRQLEIAMVLAAQARVLLLDEPLAGMGLEESHAMVALLQRLAVNHAILLVEHDMDAVFTVASVITVMVNGEVLASGAPDAIRANVDVQQAYLGAEDMQHG